MTFTHLKCGYTSESHCILSLCVETGLKRAKTNLGGNEIRFFFRLVGVSHKACHMRPAVFNLLTHTHTW